MQEKGVDRRVIITQYKRVLFGAQRYCWVSGELLIGKGGKC